LDTKDPLGGERAPAGPKYNRDGSVRTAWYDPLGWAGLDKVPPPGLTPARLKEHITELTKKQETLQAEIVQKRESVRLLALEVQSLHETDYLHHLYRTQAEKLAAEQEALQALYARSTALAETSTAAQTYLAKIERGDWGDPQAHLHHKHPPQPPLGKQARITELWAAVSGGLLLLALTILLLLFPHYWLGLGLTVAAIFITIEATVRGRLANLLLNVTILLAVVNGLILIWEFWWLILLVAAFAMVILMIRENLRELWQE
jgi:hypothetical protein